MSDYVSILGRKFEYDFLSGWIKYCRIEAGISQEALAYGICSTSHLSYFEKGKKRLRAELIEALLRKLNITNIVNVDDMGLIRQKFHRLIFEVEGFDYESADATFAEILTLEPILSASPYNIEFSIYKLMYNSLVERKGYAELKNSIDLLDKVYDSLSSDLKHLFMLVSGKFLYENLNHTEGIKRLQESYKIKETPWINYRLGVAFCNNLEHLKGIVYLEKALSSYLISGRYRNSLECHSFLGSSYCELKMYEQSEKHLMSVLHASDYFSLNKNLFGVYTNLAHLYFKMGRFDESISYCSLAMNQESTPAPGNRWVKASWNSVEQPMAAACIYVEVHKALKEPLKCREIFDKYLTDAYKNSVYYKFLYSLYLSIFHFDEELFYNEVTNIVLPYYRKIGYLNLYKRILFLLIDHLESRRKYKEANSFYRELML